MSSGDFHRGVLRLRIRKDAFEPVYVQIAKGIRGLIESIPADKGTPVPPERILCQHFGVSRMTVRQALDQLEREGWINSVRGLGTFVAGKPLEKQQQEFRGFSEEIAARGARASSRLIALTTHRPDEVERGFFGLDDDELVYNLERVRLADNVPLALETARLPVKLFPDLSRFDFESNSLYQTLEDEYGVRVARSLEEIAAVLPDARNRKLLQVPRQGAVLQIQRKTYSEEDVPVELTFAVIRGDLYRAVVRSSRPRRGN
ncbi:MAG TPA: GntR family transcriptional regulator [Bryobacteraceae bacterium]|nr:GntR family transcriptional regulator [Bryobacteraceae bacterium]